MTKLLEQLATTGPAQLPALYDQIDAQIWSDLVDLPLVAVPVLVATAPGLLNVGTGAYFGDLAWDEEIWGFASP